MEPTPGPRQGILGSIQRLAQTGLAIAQNRLELFLVEFQEERLQFFEALLLTGIVLVLGSMTLALVTCTVVVLCVCANRFDLLIGLGLIYLLATVVAFLRLRKLLKNWAPFSASLAEVKKDLACLDEKT
jgi:uncharacterized membrane protein YqjE